jgi:hypothetical protein
MKKKGIVQEECREMLRDLQTLNVPVEKLNEVVHVVEKGLGVKVMDNVSTRTIGRVMREGGVAAEMQIVHEIEQAKGAHLLHIQKAIRGPDVHMQDSQSVETAPPSSI